VQEQSRSKTA